MVNTKQKRPFYKKPEWYIPILISIFLALFFGGKYLIKINSDNQIQNINSPIEKSPQCVGENCQQNIVYNECDPYEILKRYDELKNQNQSVCISNLTTYYYEKCGFGFSAYYFDSCDIMSFIDNLSFPIDYARYFIVYPSWGKTQGDYYFFDEFLF